MDGNTQKLAKEPLDNRPEQSATSRFWSGMTTVQENRASISLNSPVCGGAYQERSPLGVLRSAPHESYSESLLMDYGFGK